MLVSMVSIGQMPRYLSPFFIQLKGQPFGLIQQPEMRVYLPVHIEIGGLNNTDHSILILYLNGQAVLKQSAENGIVKLQVHIPQRYGEDRFYNSLMQMGLSIGDEECGFSRHLEAAIVSATDVTSEPQQRASFIGNDFVRFSFGCEDAQYVEQRVSESRAQVASSPPSRLAFSSFARSPRTSSSSSSSSSSPSRRSSFL